MDTRPITASNVVPRRTSRLVAVASTVATASALWAVIEPGLGIELRGPVLGGPETMDVGLAPVAGGSLMVALAGWALLAALERAVSRPRRTWTALALLVLLVSLTTPLFGTGITTANRVSLVLLHLAVGATLIPLLRRTATASTSELTGRRGMLDGGIVHLSSTGEFEPTITVRARNLQAADPSEGRAIGGEER